MGASYAFEVDSKTIGMYTNKSTVDGMAAKGYTKVSVGRCTRLNANREQVRSTAVFFYHPNGMVAIHDPAMPDARKRKEKKMESYLRKFRVEMSNKVGVGGLFPP